METIKTIDFGEYHVLRQILIQPDFKASKQKELQLSSQKYTDTPPARALKLFPRIQIIDLSFNKIERFNPQNLIKGAPLLREFNISQNNIKTLDDIVELGRLKHLSKLNFLENPIAKRLIRVKIIEFLLFPAKYKSHDNVKILTAAYEHVPNNAKIDTASKEEEARFLRVSEREPYELESKDLKYFKARKSDQRESLAKLSTKPCPVPRKTFFRCLSYSMKISYRSKTYNLSL